MRKITLVFGTRPEAIKMCPLVLELKKRIDVIISVIVTGQHREMLHQVLQVFGIKLDVDLDIMRSGQTLFGVTTAIRTRLHWALEQDRPDVVLVHGDTTSAFAAGLCCFYLHIPVDHVEAGLRTFNIESPFPEEFNRQAVSLMAQLHFAPTLRAKENLLLEGKPKESIYVTGNTAIDALATTVRADYTHPELAWAEGRRQAIAAYYSPPT